MVGAYDVVDTDAHYLEDLETVAGYMDEPWRRRLQEGGEIARSKFFGSSTGDRFVWGRIEREHSSYPDAPMQVDEIDEGMEFLGLDATIQLSHQLLAMPRIQADDDRVKSFATAYTRYMLDQAVDPGDGIYTVLPIPYTDVEASVELIDEYADDPAIVAGCMITAGAEPPLGNEQYNPIYQAAEDAGLPLIFHTGGSGLDSLKNKGYSKFIETHTLGFLEGNMSQLVSLVCQGIPEKFPDLDVTFQESGIFWVPMIMHRLDEEYLKRPSEAPVLTRRPSEYIKEMYFGTQPFEASGDPKHLEYTIEMLGGADRLMYASDWPHWDFDRPTTITDVEFLSQEEKQKILADNAREVFGL